MPVSVDFLLIWNGNPGISCVELPAIHREMDTLPLRITHNTPEKENNGLPRFMHKNSSCGSEMLHPLPPFFLPVQYSLLTLIPLPE
jgi:hypothetical protein